MLGGGERRNANTFIAFSLFRMVTEPLSPQDGRAGRQRGHLLGPAPPRGRDGGASLPSPALPSRRGAGAASPPPPPTPGGRLSGGAG